jgi:hypothetical protein
MFAKLKTFMLIVKIMLFFLESQVLILRRTKSGTAGMVLCQRVFIAARAFSGWPGYPGAAPARMA